LLVVAEYFYDNLLYLSHQLEHFPEGIQFVNLLVVYQESCRSISRSSWSPKSPDRFRTVRLLTSQSTNMDIIELQAIALQELESWKPTRIRCCTAAGCLSSGAAAVKNSLETAVAQANLDSTVEVCSVGFEAMRTGAAGGS
jgi:hypothetical protein